MNSFQNRIIRACMLDSNLYEEVEADKSTQRQAMAVVVLASIAGGIAFNTGNLSGGGLSGIITGIIASLASWYVWAYLTYFIGTKFLPEPQTKADLGELLRTIGFASSPGLLRIFCVIPGVGMLAYSISSVWMLVAMIIAVRQALDYNSTLRAVLVCVIGYVFQIFVIVLIFSIFGGALPNG